MATYLLEQGRFESRKADGTPNSNGKLYTYVADTVSDAKTTYSDPGLTTPNANPVILDAAGSAIVYYTGDMKIRVDTSDDVTLFTQDNVTPVDLLTVTTVTGATTLTSANNNGVILATGTGYSITLDSAANLGAGWSVHIDYRGTGTLTLARTSGGDSINGTAGNLTIPANWSAMVVVNAGATGFEIVGSDTSRTITWTKGADIASANALPMDSNGNYRDVTGTTPITSINSVGVGTVIKLHFDDALTFTHHATDLILPGAANITTAAGDEAELVEYATGDWRCTGYIRASGLPVVQRSLDVQTFNSSGTWNKPSGYSSTTRVYIQAWGGGGSGGLAAAGSAGGGGGGSYRECWKTLSDLGSSETVTVGAGGAGLGAPGTGNNGGSSTFGSHITAYGGVGGSGTNAGGAGGGWFSTATAGTRTNDTPTNDEGYGGDPAGTLAGRNGIWLGGGGGAGNGSSTGDVGGNSIWGGGGGGSASAGQGKAGGTSVYGGNGAEGATTTAGSQPGGGGGVGVSGSSNSGAGGAGRIVVTVFA